ncbi:cation:proton antiporter [Atopobiaceae bacterium 24-176]
MATSLFSLAVICLVAFVGPFLADLVPGRWLQASAFILILGALLGPHGTGLIDPTAPGLALLKQLGLAFLFLIGGYGLEPRRVLGATGRHAALSWLASFGLGLLVACALPFDFSWKALVAFAISLTSTAFSKVEGVLKERHALDTPMGRIVESYGATGELLPVMAVALLLEERSPMIELGIIGLFVVLALVSARLARHEEERRTRLDSFVRDGRQAGQMMLRLVICVLVGFVALGVILGADMIVAGFAAGFILRQLVGEDDAQVMPMVQAVANGFFIPVTFVMSGAAIDVFEGGSEPLVILGFIGLLLVVRGVPCLVSLSVAPETRSMPFLRRVNIAIYTCTAMSTVVAMTSVAVESGDMTHHIANVLVFAAALTTITVPIVTRLIGRADGEAAVEGKAAGATNDTEA